MYICIVSLIKNIFFKFLVMDDVYWEKFVFIGNKKYDLLIFLIFFNLFDLLESYFYVYVIIIIEYFCY